MMVMEARKDEPGVPRRMFNGAVTGRGGAGIGAVPAGRGEGEEGGGLDWAS